MKPVELRKMSIEDLNSELLKTRNDMANMKFRADAEQEKNTGHMRTLRKNIARIKTMLTEKTG